MLHGLQIVTIATLVWGNLCFATSATSQNDAAGDLQTISSWMAHLNYYYPDLNVTVAKNSQLESPTARQQLMNDLNRLENIMGQGSHLPDSSLMHIACGRPECNGGGSGGKCSTCGFDKE